MRKIPVFFALFVCSILILSPLRTLAMEPISPLPTDIPSLFPRFTSQITGYSGADNWQVGSITNRTKPASTLYAYYVQEGSTGKLEMFDDSWASTYKTIYNTTYAWVKDLNVSSENFYEQLHAITNSSVTCDDGSNGCVDLKVAQNSSQKASDILQDEMIPQMANVYAGLQMLSHMAGDSTITPPISGIFESPANYYADLLKYGGLGGVLAGRTDIPGDIVSSSNDLDLNNAASLQKPQKFADYLGGKLDQSAQDFTSKNDTLEHYYQDIQLVSGVLSDPAVKLATQKDATSLQIKIKTVGQQLDGQVTSVGSSIDATKNQRCGSAPNNPIVLPTVDTFIYFGCVITDYFSQFVDTILLSGAELLSLTAGIPNAAQPSIDNKFSFVDGGKPATSIWGKWLPADVKTPYQTLMVDPGSDVGKTVIGAQGIVTKILDTLIILIFLGVAIMNILQIQIATFSIRKLIPGILIGFILAQASFFIIRAGLEVVGQASNGILTLATDKSHQSSSLVQNFVDAFSHVRGKAGSACLTVNSSPSDCGNKGIDNGLVFQQFVLNLFVLAAAVCLFILGFLFGARVFIFTILVPIAPIAVFCRFFPPLGFIWSKWYKTASSWIIMPIPAIGLLTLSGIYFRLGSNANTPDPSIPTAAMNHIASHLTAAAGAVSSGSSFFGYMLNYIAGMAFLIAAIKVPFTFAGEAKGFMDRYNALGKLAYNGTVGAGIKYGAGEAKNEFQARVGESFIGAAQRKYANKKSDKEEAIKARKAGTPFNPKEQERKREREIFAAQSNDYKNYDNRLESLDTELKKYDSTDLNKEKSALEFTKAKLTSQYLAATDPATKAALRSKVIAIAGQIKSVEEKLVKSKDLQASYAATEKERDAKYKPEAIKEIRRKISVLDIQSSKDKKNQINERTYSAEIRHQKEVEMRKGTLDTAKSKAQLGLSNDAPGNEEFKRNYELSQLGKQDAAKNNEQFNIGMRKYVNNADSIDDKDLAVLVKSSRIEDAYEARVEAELIKEEEEQEGQIAQMNRLFVSGGSEPTDSESKIKAYQKANREVGKDIIEKASQFTRVRISKILNTTDIVPFYIELLNSQTPTNMEKLSDRKSALIDLLAIHQKIIDRKSSVVDIDICACLLIKIAGDVGMTPEAALLDLRLISNGGKLDPTVQDNNKSFYIGPYQTGSQMGLKIAKMGRQPNPSALFYGPPY